ncbi:hypothetical protein [Mixta gaviniae]|nr:hypothetical protein [Mixta gaviniae]
MNIDSWIDGLRWLDVDQKVQVHFELQEQIKHHYRLRGEGDHLQRAIHLCEQSVAFAELALPALKEKWGRDFGGDFYPPSHYGYRQLITIMKKQKNLQRVSELERKREREGWAK